MTQTRDEWAAQARHGTITTGDHCRIAWRCDGREDAPVLILSNSLGTTMDMWQPQAGPFAEHFRVIRYDTRGHGGSGSPDGAYSLDRLGCDVIELADALGIGTFSFCGLSLGGMTAQWLGWRAPDRLERIVIANSSPYMGPPLAWQQRIDTVRGQGMGAIADAVIERWFTQKFRACPDNIADLRTALLATSATGYAGCCAAIRDMDMRPVLGLVQVPALVIGGTHDPATPPDHCAQLASGIPDAQCAMFPAAHLSSFELPREFNAAVLFHLLGAL